MRSSVLGIGDTRRGFFRRGGAAHRGVAALLAASLMTSGCSAARSADDFFFGKQGQQAEVKGFLGVAVADEPQAALVARQVLAAGGTAGDAATALGLALSVTLPSRAGLGGGGGCLAYNTGKTGPRAPEAILFPASAPAGSGGGDRPPAVPMLARGLYLLHFRYGVVPFETLVMPAEQLARQGVASRAFLRDLGVVAGPLAADPGARAVFFRDGRPVDEGAAMPQPELSTTLAQIRVAGAGDMYEGALAQRVVEAAARVGGGITLGDLKTAVPKLVPPLFVPGRGNDRVALLPPPVDGGLATAVAFQTLLANPAAGEVARSRSLAAAASWRRGGVTAEAVLAGGGAGGSLPPLPASTSFATLDRNGNAVVCVLTMNNLFGTGRIAPGTGMLLAASPSWMPPPLLAAGLTYDARELEFRAVVGASGQEAAPLAAAIGLLQAEAGQVPNPTTAPDPGRVNVIACRTDNSASCHWATDPRGAGLATGGED